VILGVLLVAVSAFNLVEWHDRVTASPEPDPTLAWPPVANGPPVVIGDALTAQRPSTAVDGSAPVVPSVRIVASGCRGTVYGSGVVVAGERVLTARHVVAGADRIVVETERGSRRVARTVVVDRDGRDAALLSVPGIGDGGAGIEVTLAEPERGDSVAVTGHPEGGRLHIDYTTVTTYTAQPPLAANGTRVMIVDDDFAEGMSGGPVTDGEGRVVGIAIGIEVNTKIGIVTPMSGLGRLLAGNGDPLPASC
jgi:S1-C subfamily serine protease